METTAISSEWARSVVARLWNDGNSLFDMSAMLRESISLGNPTANELQVLALEFLRAATVSSHPENRMIECLKMLAHAEHITWTTFLLTITRFNCYRKGKCVIALCTVLEDQLPNLQCPFSSMSDSEAFMEAVIEVFRWIVTALKFCLIDHNNDADNKQSKEQLLRTFSIYINDSFIFRIMALASRRHAAIINSSIIQEIRSISSILSQKDIIYIELESKLSLIFEPLKFELQGISTGYKLRHSGVRTLTAVFSCFRVLTPIDEVADTIMMFGTINSLSHEEIITDMFHSSLMILLEEQETRDSCKSSIEMFFYVKMPRVWASMIKMGMARECIVRGVHIMIKDCRQVIDSVDAAVKDNTIRTIVRQLTSAQVMREGDAELLISERNEQLKMHPELSYLYRDDLRQSQAALVLNAVQAKHVAEKVWGMQEKLMTVLTRLIGSGGYAFDSLCASYGLEGNLRDMSSKLASLNQKSETPTNAFTDRSMTFDLSFTMLTRIAYKYNTLSLRELVTDPSGMHDYTNSAFYRWSSRYAKRISHVENTNEHEYIVVTPELKHQYKERVARLKDRHVFWDSNTCDYGQLVDIMPIVGEIILDEFKEKRHVEEDLKRIFSSFRKSICLLVCIVQWLESQEPLDARRQMARCIKMALEENIADEKDKEEKDRWMFTRTVCRRQLDEMCDYPSVVPPMTITLMAIAKRSFPQLYRKQVPDNDMLKKAWLFAQRQNWASPNVLHLIDHSNRARGHRTWFEFYMHHMMKLRCPDVMNKAIEMICACALLDPIDTLITACVLMVDFMMEKNSQIQFEVPYVIPLVQLLTQVLLMSVWVLDRERRRMMQRRIYVPQLKKSKMGVESETNESFANPGVQVLQETIDVAINKFVKESGQGSLYQPISFVCHIVRMIASAPNTEAKKLLTSAIPHLLFFQLARLEPGSMSLELFSVFCDESNPEHNKEKLKFLCLLRKCGGL